MTPRKKLRRDLNETAFDTLQAVLGEGPRPTPPGEGDKNPEAVKRGRKGGKVGGKARAESLTAKERTRVARKAAKARWKEPPAEE